MHEQDLYYSSLRGKLLGGRAREQAVKRLLKQAKPTESFLEVGCSYGHYVDYMNSRTERTVGVDIEEKKIRRAKKRCKGAEFYAIDGTRLPFKAKEFDWVLCTEVLEHIPDWKKAVKEIRRVAKGKVVITIPIEEGYFWGAATWLGFGLETRGHVHSLLSSDIEKEMKGFGLQEKHFVATPSRKLNKVINGVDELNSLYSVMLFKRNGK